MSSLLTLPLELIHEVISTAALLQSNEDDDDDADAKLLSRCGLVCKTFYHVTRELRFHEVKRILDAKEAQLIPEIVTYQHKDLSLPPLIRYVQELDITFDVTRYSLDEEYVGCLDAFLAPFFGEACRIRDFTFTAKKDESKPRTIDLNALFWHELPPSTQQKFADIFRSTSLEVIDISGIVDLPFRLLRSATSSLRCLALAATSVAVEAEDLDPPPGRIPPPFLALEELKIGGLRFTRGPYGSLLSEPDENDDKLNLALHDGLSQFINLSSLTGLVVSQAPQDAHIRGDLPPLREIFALCSNLETVQLQFYRCEYLYSLHLDKLPSSVTWFELHALYALPFTKNRAEDLDTQLTFPGPNNAALYPTDIASSSHPKPQLSGVAISQPLFVYQSGATQPERLVMLDGSTSYWDALVQNSTTIPAATIYLEIEVNLKIDPGFSSMIPEDVRPDEKIEAEMNRVFGEYNTSHPDKPIVVQYACSVTAA